MYTNTKTWSKSRTVAGNVSVVVDNLFDVRYAWIKPCLGY